MQPTATAVPTMEPATPDSFVEDNYVFCNDDIAAFVRGGGSATEHFERHGRHESRRQLSRAFMEGRSAAGRLKYETFGPLLDAALGAGGQFSFLKEPDAFPVSYGTGAYSISAYERESANNGFSHFIHEIEANPDKLYLDLGCGFRSHVHPNCLYLEVYPSITADLILQPACTYPIASESLDGIGCFAVLEHVEQPWVVAAEMHRMLKPGGMLYIDWPFLQPVHGYPSHYYNATRAGLGKMFEQGFDIQMLDTLANQTPDYSIVWLLREFGRALEDEQVKADFHRMTVSDLIETPVDHPTWRRIMAATPEKSRMTFACGNSLVARKR